jgi:hypothetical protein
MLKRTQRAGDIHVHPNALRPSLPRIEPWSMMCQIFAHESSHYTVRCKWTEAESVLLWGMCVSFTEYPSMGFHAFKW